MQAFQKGGFIQDADSDKKEAKGEEKEVKPAEHPSKEQEKAAPVPAVKKDEAKMKKQPVAKEEDSKEAEKAALVEKKEKMPSGTEANTIQEAAK